MAWIQIQSSVMIAPTRMTVAEAMLRRPANPAKIVNLSTVLPYPTKSTLNQTLSGLDPGAQISELDCLDAAETTIGLPHRTVMGSVFTGAGQITFVPRRVV